MSASAVELGLLDDFWVLGPSFPQRFWATNSLRTLKISSSAVELVFEDILGTAGTQFLSTVSEPVVVFVR